MARKKKQTTEDVIWDLKFTIKSLNKRSAKAKKESEKQRLRIKDAIRDCDKERANIYAQMSIAKKQESLNLLRLAAKMDMVISDLSANMEMQNMNKDIASLNVNLQSMLETNDVISMCRVMDDFQERTGELAHNTSMMGNSLNTQTASAAPVDMVDSVIQ
ncbi:hypothetical protein KIPB_011349, partial [Kipferlia bialata]|eukprot:g11349.t1